MAASFVPSLEDVMLYHCVRYPFCMYPTLSSVQVAPEFVEVQMFPPKTTVASLVPSLEEAMLSQYCVLPRGLRSVQMAPESVEVQMAPLP